MGHPAALPPLSSYSAAAATADRAVRAMQRWQQASPPDDGELRTAICAFVAVLRARGLPPQTAIVATKRLLEAAGIFPAWVATHRALAERVVRWSIDEYYRPESAT